MSDNVVSFSSGASIFDDEVGLKEDDFFALCQDVIQLKLGADASVVAYLAADRNNGDYIGYGLTVSAEVLEATHNTHEIHLIQASRRRVIFTDLNAVGMYLRKRGVWHFEVNQT